MKWTVTSGSVRGSAHQRSGLPNQDAVYHRNGDRASGLRAVVAVSDGHGGARHFRSQVGASLAANTAVNVLYEDLSSMLAEVPPPDSPGERVAGILNRIVADWRSAVLSDLSNNPFLESELGALEKGEGDAARASVEQDPLLAYGATLLAAAVADEFVLYLQLGDGDILAIEDAGATTRPVPADHRLIANHTTSLCQESALADTRFALSREIPALILLSTDGYANSFRSDADFLKIGADYLEIIRQQGLETVADQLPETLSAASTEGSGDDITLGILYRAASPSRTGTMQTLAAVPSASPAASPSPASPKASRQPGVGNLMRIAAGVALLGVAGATTWIATHREPTGQAQPAAQKSPASPLRVPASAQAPKKDEAYALQVKSGARLELQPGTSILFNALQTERAPSTAPYAEVRRDAISGAWELVNLSQDTWTVQRPGKATVEPPVEGGSAVVLSPKLKITFRGGVVATVQPAPAL